MAEILDLEPQSARELVLARLINAPRHCVYRAWSEPELLKEWFVPRPWTIAAVDMDVRVGGRSRIVMRNPEGEEFPNEGIFLEVVPNERLVTTDAYTEGWLPTEKPFMTAVVTFEDAGDNPPPSPPPRHWTEADRKAHEEMGFHEGWGQCAEQLEAVAQRLSAEVSERMAQDA